MSKNDVVLALDDHLIRDEDAQELLRRAKPHVRAGARKDGLELILRGVVAGVVGVLLLELEGPMIVLPFGAFATAFVCTLAGIIKALTGWNVR